MSELSRRNETNPIAMVDVYLRNNRVHIHAENLERGGARYFTEVDGREIHKFKDENIVTKMRLFSYYATYALSRKGFNQSRYYSRRIREGSCLEYFLCQNT